MRRTGRKMEIKKVGRERDSADMQYFFFFCLERMQDFPEGPYVFISLHNSERQMLIPIYSRQK